MTLVRTGKRQELKDVEADTAEIRKRNNKLTYEDLEKIRNSEHWNADQFGYWPSRSEIERNLNTHWKFHNLHRAPKRERKTIEGLLGVFRQIEIVSVILRFIDPRHYGILSPPVEKMLGIGPFRDRTKKYLNYLGNLKQLKESRGFETAADVDVALWVLQLGVEEGRLEDQIDPSKYQALRDGFEQDRELKLIRMGNLAPQLFKDMPRLDLARVLLGAGNSQMAGQLAGCELERRVARKADISPFEYKRRLHEMVDLAWNDRATTVKFKHLVRVRNKAIHGQPVSDGEVMALIEANESVEA